jgi:hypothetical protein
MNLTDAEIDRAIQRGSFGDVRKLLRAMQSESDARLRIEVACRLRLNDGTMTSESARRTLSVIARSFRRPKGRPARASTPLASLGNDVNPATLPRPANRHELLERKSLVHHRLIAQKIRESPALLGKARENVARLTETVSPASRPYLQEWLRLLDQGMEAALAVAIEDSERAAALRQSSPFTALLTEEEAIDFERWWRLSRWWTDDRS